LHVLELSNNYTVKHLEEDLINLIFKKNILFKWFIPHEGLRYIYAESKMTNNLNVATDNLEVYLNSVGELLDDDKTKGYLERCQYVLRILNKHFDNKNSISENQINQIASSMWNNLDAKKIVLASSGVLLLGMFAYRTMNSNIDNDELHYLNNLKP